MSYKYVILLRGVNVGGTRRVLKNDFQAVLATLGCHDIIIYINSGNAAVTSSAPLNATLLQAALEAYFGFAIPCLVLPARQVQAIAAAIPVEWTNDRPQPDKSGQKSDVLYLFQSANHPQILAEIGYRPEIETMLYVDGAVLATVSRANQSRGSVQKLIGSQLYNNMTIRNITTAKKLAELVATL